MRPWRVVVAGTNFGRVHAEGVRAAAREFTLAGFVSRGGDRSRREAAAFGVAHFAVAEPADVAGCAELDDVDAACVVVGSAVSGGRGTELACALLERGIAVLAEHPMHPDEITACLRAARRGRTAFRITTHYPHVAPVRAFLDAAGRLRARQAPLFVDAATPVHVLHPFLDIVARALGGVRPWAFADPDPFPAELTALAGREGPLRTVSAVVAGVPVTVRVHNQLHPGDRDNHALLWHRIAIGTEGGVLTLADTHGPVLWSPRFHAARDADGHLVLDGSGLHRDSTTVLEPAGTLAEAVTGLWPDAVSHALRGLRAAAEAGTDPLRDGQLDLTVARMWTDLAARLGPPETIRPAAPEVLDAADLLPRRRSAGVGYGATAEFFELSAAAHTAAAAPALRAALAGVDPAQGPVVEIGAGSGLGTAVIAAALPGARILAAEPSVVLRAVLTSRVVRDPDLRDRVTIVPESAEDLTLPERISGVVLCGVVGHLDAAARHALWRRLAQRLAPGAPLVVELMAIDTPVAMAPTRLATTSLGGRRHEWWFSAAPDPDDHTDDGDTDGDALLLRSTWRVGADGDGGPGGVPPRQETEQYRWHAFGLDRVAAETGFTLRVLRGDSAPLGVFIRAS